MLDGGEDGAATLKSVGTLFDDADLDAASADAIRAKHAHEDSESSTRVSVSELTGMSARQLARARRLSKVQMRNRTTDGQGAHEAEPPTKRARPSAAAAPASGPEDVADDGVLCVPDGHWPFEALCDELSHALFDPVWEIRHGAAMGLRDLLRHQARGAGRVAGTSDAEQTEVNLRCLEDLAVRVLCVFALDRFGDFVSDQTVAPVREACAQTLGTLLQHMPAASVRAVLSALLQLGGRSEWEARHSCVLGLKYLLAVRTDLATELLSGLMPVLLDGLRDVEDDVRAVAAEALLPVTAHLADAQMADRTTFLGVLWNALLEMDDLSVSTSGVLRLLADLLNRPAGFAASAAVASVETLLPRLWPYLRHTIAPVRRAAYVCVARILAAVSQGTLSAAWLPGILDDLSRHIVQGLLLETRSDVLSVIEQACGGLMALLVSAPVPLAALLLRRWHEWFRLACTPAGQELDATLLLHAAFPTSTVAHASRLRRTEPTSGTAGPHAPPAASLAATMAGDDVAATRARLATAEALGALAASLHTSAGQQAAEPLADHLVSALEGDSAIARQVAGWVSGSWAQHMRSHAGLPARLKDALLALLTAEEVPVFREFQPLVAHVRAEAIALAAALAQCGVSRVALEQIGDPATLTMQQALEFVGPLCERWLCAPDAQHRASATHAATLSRARLQATLAQLESCAGGALGSAQAAAAAAVVAAGCWPSRLNPVIRPLMDGLKVEENEQLHGLHADAIASLLDACRTHAAGAVDKIVANVCKFACSDAATPASGALVLELDAGDAHAPSGAPLPDRSCQRHDAAIDAIDVGAAGPACDADANALVCAARRIRRGGELALKAMARQFGARLFRDLPAVYRHAIVPIMIAGGAGGDDGSSSRSNEPGDTPREESSVTALMDALRVLEILVPHLDPALLPTCLELLPALMRCLRHGCMGVRYRSARALAAIYSVSAVRARAMEATLDSMMHALGDMQQLYARQGAAEALYVCAARLGIDIVPYIAFTVLPVLGRMSDPDGCVRGLCARTFAMLVRLMPLDSSTADPSDFSPELRARRQSARRFIEQLLDPSKAEPYRVPVPCTATLRAYQRDGVNWLRFLYAYGLHGVLCDDMGLGKTLQTLCVLAGSHHERRERYAMDPSATDAAPLPSLVVCPPTLLGHWQHEAARFFPSLRVLVYAGPPKQRASLQARLRGFDVIVTSYDSARNDVDFLQTLRLNYCVLDEGHVIKNAQSKTARAVKQLSALHRLILSGTPIQNSVLELWSLFDFLMPGFLGTERAFNQLYSKPILASRDAKASSHEHEAGALALEALHRQVLPFVLRRTKEQVLRDLPPKIIQDHLCELSPLQALLYEDFSRSHAREAVAAALAGGDATGRPALSATGHVFQALQYLRKLCNHPLLVLSPDHPMWRALPDGTRASLHDLAHAPKLQAVQQLLLDCGIGVAGGAAAAADDDGGGGGNGGSSSSSTEERLLDGPVVGQHRVLIFCQIKAMLDLLERDLLQRHMPSVSYLRLDGSVEAAQRHAIVTRFNEDPSIDVLLLTTHVGGLGVNLSGADTVIIVEHDWNPMRDLQAMDRAHRIGQTRVVTVYRLIMRGTLEEKIMGCAADCAPCARPCAPLISGRAAAGRDRRRLQRFKLGVANAVVTDDNASLRTMDTAQLLDLFSAPAAEAATTAEPGSGPDAASGRPAARLLDGLTELWDEAQYEAEYDLGAFVRSLARAR